MTESRSGAAAECNWRWNPSEEEVLHPYFCMYYELHGLLVQVPGLCQLQHSLTSVLLTAKDAWLFFVTEIENHKR